MLRKCIEVDGLSGTPGRVPAAEVNDPEEVAEDFRNLSGTASVELYTRLKVDKL